MEIGRDRVEQQPTPSSDLDRNAILVVAGLIATASFTAVMDPPDGIKNNSNAVKLIFTCANAIAWSSSMQIISFFIATFPYKIEMYYFPMLFAFSLAAGALANIGHGVPYIIFVVCVSLPFVCRWLFGGFKSIYGA